VIERARQVVRVAKAGPGMEPDLGAPGLPEALVELGVIICLAEAAALRSGGPGSQHPD
jgi:hypothetical protein